MIAHMEESLYYSVSETMEILGISRATLTRWTKSGHIQGNKRGKKELRYLKSEVHRVDAGVDTETGEQL